MHCTYVTVWDKEYTGTKPLNKKRTKNIIFREENLRKHLKKSGKKKIHNLMKKTTLLKQSSGLMSDI